MRPFGRHLHNQIIVPLVAASIVVAIVATLVASTLIGRITQSWIDESVESVIINTRSRLEETSVDLQRSAKMAAEDSRLVDAASKDDVQRLSGVLVLLNQSLGADNLMLLDDWGTVLASTGRLQLMPGVLPLGGTDRDRVVLSMSHPILIRIGPSYTLTALQPVKGPGGRTFMLALSSIVDDAFVRSVSEGSVAVVGIYDSSGRPVAVRSMPSDSGQTAAALRQPVPAVRQALAQIAENKTVPLSAGGAMFSLRAAVISFKNDPTGSSAYLVAAMPTTVAEQTRRTTTNLILMWSALAVLVLLTLNWWVARRVSEPLVELSDSVARVAEGDFSAKVSFRGTNEITRLADNLNVMTDSLRERSESLTKKVLELATLYEMSRSLGSTLDLETLLDLVLDSAMRIFNVELGYVTLRDHESGQLIVRSLRGSSAPRPDEAAVRASMPEWVVREGRPLIFNPPRVGEEPNSRIDSVSGALAALCVPLVSAEGTMGAITVGSRDSQRRFGSDDVRLLATIANHVTIAIGNIDLFSSLQDAYLATVRALAAAVDAKDPYTRGHSDTVAQLAIAIGEKMALAPEQRTALEMAAYLHDIGKIGISEDILLKAGKLTDEEMAQMRHHPLIGANILKPIAFPWPIAPVVRHHHEHYDGRGYPAGLKGEEIPLLARVLTVADAYEAMVSDRPYRRGRSQEDAMLELRRCSGTQFDPRVVEAFIRVLSGDGGRFGAQSAPSPEEFGPEEAAAVFVAVYDGMFARFRRLGGPRLAANLEQDINEAFAEEGLPYMLTAGHLVYDASDEVSGAPALYQMRTAIAAAAAFIERTAGASLVSQFYAEAIEALPERMRRQADHLGLWP
ncbi:MAG: HD domain-containing protein [Actinomycetia bacterium]|nr:HD domain-containing protein [Actinomycetes bacterium]